MSDRLDDVVERLVRIEDRIISVEDRLTSKVEDLATRLGSVERFIAGVKGATQYAAKAFGWLVATSIAIAGAWMAYLGIHK